MFFKHLYVVNVYLNIMFTMLILDIYKVLINFIFRVLSYNGNSVLWEMEQGSVLPMAVLICPSAVCSA